MIAATKNAHSASDCLVLWDRWTAAVDASTGQKKPKWRVSPDKYRVLHRELLQSCRQAATTEQDNHIYARMENIVAPWVSLEAFTHTDRQVLRGLLDQCDEVSRTLGRRPRRRRTKGHPLLWSAMLLVVVLGIFYLAGYDDYRSISLEARRIFRRFQFSLAGSDFLQAFSVFTVVAIGSGMWLVNSVRKS